MYKIEKINCGLKITFKGFIDCYEMANWLSELKDAVGIVNKDFGVIVDMTELNPLPENSTSILQQGQKYCKKMGMTRSVVIVNNVITKIQFRRLAKESGIDSEDAEEQFEIISQLVSVNAMEKAVNWILCQLPKPEGLGL